MNKNAIQKFAIWARTELIAQVSQRAYQYGIDETGFGDPAADTIGGRVLTQDEKSQRQKLIKQIQEKGYSQVMEEVAYTWFNRFIALRFMEVNNYLPSHIRVFSDSSGAFKPEILNDVLHLDLPGLDRSKVEEYIESNDTEALYRYLLLVQCNALSKSLPVLFAHMDDDTALLLPNNILKQDSILGRMVKDIPENDWGVAEDYKMWEKDGDHLVQIIGWLYQYYNAELKDDTFALLKKNVKITKERIPAATQLFTPDWIVKYMVENSLGRLWLEGHPNGELRQGWRYYLDEAEQEPDVEAQLVRLREEYKTIRPEEIKIIDPCMGSGHILVYAFDVLMQIYTSAGWDQREATRSILENNLYGLDIDTRAAQLAYFAVMMKARQYDRRILTRGIHPNVRPTCESNGIQGMVMEYFHKNDPKLKADIESIVREMRDAKEYGSILTVTPVDFAGLYARFDEIRDEIDFMQMAALNQLLPLVKCAEMLARKYDVVVTNPPYMAVSNGDNALNKFIKDNYPDSKGDLFAVFIERCGQMVKSNGYQVMITQHSWMFLSSFEKLRTKLLLTADLVNMAHLGARAFEEIAGEVVQTTSFVLRKSHVPGYKGEYCRLIEPTTQQGKEDMFLAGKNRYAADQSNFSKIPGSPVAYWLDDAFLRVFEQGTLLGDLADAKQGVATADNNRFLRRWHEVSIKKTSFKTRSHEEAATASEKWFPYNKGGEFRKWYGNNEFLVNWEHDGIELKNFKGAVLRNPTYYFRECFSWSLISSSVAAFRYKPIGQIFDVAGMSCFSNAEQLKFFLALCNSKVVMKILEVIAPTINYQCGDIANIPILHTNQTETIDNLTQENIDNSRLDWDSYETSWDFKRNPLV